MKVESEVLIDFHFENAEGKFPKSQFGSSSGNKHLFGLLNTVCLVDADFIHLNQSYTFFTPITEMS
jgi:hypothetical protein